MPARHVLYLPGLMCDQRLFTPQIEALNIESSVADMSQHDNFPDMAQSVLSAAPAEFAVAGLSMGGILAFEIWRQAPQRISHLALLDTNSQADTPGKRSMRLEQIETAVNGGLRQLAIESLKPAYLAASNRDNEGILETILDMAMALGPDVFARQSMALRNRIDSTETLRDIRCPTAVICGNEDALCPPELHQLMADSIGGATLTVIEDCGHLATLEQPARVNDELRRLFAA